MKLRLDDSSITWPGRLKTKPEGFLIPTHLQVLTIEEKPFVYARQVADSNECQSDEIPCPHYVSPNYNGIAVQNEAMASLYHIYIHTFVKRFTKVYHCRIRQVLLQRLLRGLTQGTIENYQLHI